MTSRPAARPMCATVLDPAFVELGDLEQWVFAALEDGETELIVDLAPLEPVTWEVLSMLARLRHVLAPAGVRMALVCAGSDLEALRLGPLESAYLLAASEDAAVEGLRATRSAFDATELDRG